MAEDFQRGVTFYAHLAARGAHSVSVESHQARVHIAFYGRMWNTTDQRVDKRPCEIECFATYDASRGGCDDIGSEKAIGAMRLGEAVAPADMFGLGPGDSVPYAFRFAVRTSFEALEAIRVIAADAFNSGRILSATLHIAVARDIAPDRKMLMSDELPIQVGFEAELLWATFGQSGVEIRQ